jgi:hypothetical protein
MKKRMAMLIAAGLIGAGGCNTPVSVSGNYSTAKEAVAGAVEDTTNSVTVSGSYTTTNQTAGGSVTVGK